jgi:hypothetical protein
MDSLSLEKIEIQLVTDNEPGGSKDRINDLLRAHHADGMLVIGKPIFNKTGDQLTLLRWYACGNLCGSVERLTLKKDNGRWNITDRKVISIS